MSRMKKGQKLRKIFQIPKSWQGILWSCDVKKLDWEKDKNYIIHQVLMYGDLKDISLLFKVYSKKEIRKVFKKNPMKIYTPQIFNLVKKIILEIKDKKILPEKYVKTFLY